MAVFTPNAQQARLEARAEAAMDWCQTTPGACNTVRFRGADDPEKLGWDQVRTILEEDGLMGFRLLSRDSLAGLEAFLASMGFRMDTWDVFTAEAEAIRAATAPILAAPLPDSLRLAPDTARHDPAFRDRLRGMMYENGIVPFSHGMLSGEAGGASDLVVLLEADGTPAASAYAYFPHNPHSPHADFAWGGLCAVSETRRGQGLGRLVNAMMASRAVDRLGAARLYELVAATNLPSRRMVEASGLRLDPTFVSGIASAAEGRYLR